MHSSRRTFRYSVLIELQWTMSLYFDKQPLLPKKFEAGDLHTTLRETLFYDKCQTLTNGFL